MKGGAQFRYLILLVAAFIVLFYIAKSFVNNHPAFDFSTKEGQSYTWEEYLRDREVRNIKKMNRSYSELMSLARVYLREERYKEAASTFFEAKTLFPDRLDPRKNLCYTYIMQCRDRGGLSCQLAKREIYYAMKYVPDTDELNLKYLSGLAALVDIEDLIDKPEKEALKVIF